MTLDVRNPLVWLRRIRHRRGYGVHSPFAYEMLSQVIYSPGSYYAEAELERGRTLARRLMQPRRKTVDRLLMRLANRQQPATLCAPHASSRALSYLHEGCRHAQLVSPEAPEPDMLYICKEWEEATDEPWVADGGLVVVDHLRVHRKLWKRMRREGRYQVMFDLHDVGLAFRRDGMQRDYYVVNW